MDRIRLARFARASPPLGASAFGPKKVEKKTQVYTQKTRLKSLFKNSISVLGGTYKKIGIVHGKDNLLTYALSSFITHWGSSFS
jgi:hypothetical protein